MGSSSHPHDSEIALRHLQARCEAMYLRPTFRVRIDTAQWYSSPFTERLIMTIPAIEYRGYELRAYFYQKFPSHRDLYAKGPRAKGPRRFSSVVRIDTIKPGETKAKRYATLFITASPTTAADAIDLAMQYSNDIVDGNVQASALGLNVR
jgi:hypothetical protein